MGKSKKGDGAKTKPKVRKSDPKKKSKDEKKKKKSSSESYDDQESSIDDAEVQVCYAIASTFGLILGQFFSSTHLKFGKLLPSNLFQTLGVVLMSSVQ